jgi:hypothetical protein
VAKRPTCASHGDSVILDVSDPTIYKDHHFFSFLWLNAITTIMSGRILSHRLAPLLRNGHLARHIHNAGSRTGGLLRADSGAALRGRAWPIGSNGIHNVPAVRSISFARMLPKLAMKLIRVPAMFGGATIAGLAYFQYQATRMFSMS